MFTMFRNQVCVLFQQYVFGKVGEVYHQGMDISSLQLIRMRRKLENIAKVPVLQLRNKILACNSN